MEFLICKKINSPMIKIRSAMAMMTFIVFYFHFHTWQKERPLILVMNGLTICFETL